MRAYKDPCGVELDLLRPAKMTSGRIGPQTSSCIQSQSHGIVVDFSVNVDFAGRCSSLYEVICGASLSDFAGPQRSLTKGQARKVPNHACGMII